MFKALGLTLLLAACGPKSGTNETGAANGIAPAAAAMNAMGNDMGNMAMTPGDKMAKGAGKVTAVDKAAGTITLDHGPIAEAGWPAMTMAFKASPALIDSIKVGDAVDFDLKLEGGAGEITAISKK
ncbi:copper-binding protein [Sphingobium sp. TB-6]|uniref:copper-binding protein n=1 Tax=Sphingobium sp. TB-6 TaxID=2728850 RepID=UPI0019CFA530|nr:copper-binding protein [Sphingobium sp. TB-6]